MIKNGNVGVELDHQDEFVCMADTIKDFFMELTWKRVDIRLAPYPNLRLSSVSVFIFLTQKQSITGLLLCALSKTSLKMLIKKAAPNVCYS